MVDLGYGMLLSTSNAILSYCESNTFAYVILIDNIVHHPLIVTVASRCGSEINLLLV